MNPIETWRDLAKRDEESLKLGFKPPTHTMLTIPRACYGRTCKVLPGLTGEVVQSQKNPARTVCYVEVDKLRPILREAIVQQLEAKNEHASAS